MLNSDIKNLPPIIISILLVDDEPMFRQGLKTLLAFYSANGSVSFNVVGEAASVAQAVKLAVEQHPMIILLDMELPTQDGIDALHYFRDLNYKGKVIILSAHREDELIFKAMEAGAWGYVFKDCVAQQLYDAIATVIQDEIYLAPEVVTRFFRMFHFYGGHSLTGSKTVYLTEREQEVLQWLVQGASNEQIAQHLCVTIATVKAHLTSIFEKFQVKNRSQAIVKALKLGLVSA
jgi:DNA-binding NarL/FixJ family response regulator